MTGYNFKGDNAELTKAVNLWTNDDTKAYAVKAYGQINTYGVCQKLQI